MKVTITFWHHRLGTSRVSCNYHNIACLLCEGDDMLHKLSELHIILCYDSFW
jgi:hypothetical protein